MSSNSSPSSSANESEAESNFQSAIEEIYEQKEESPVPAKEFDRRLPITHSYLGNTGQGELSSESIFVESENVINVPVLIMSEVCLLPGQTLPLQFYAQPSFQFLSDIGRQRYYFALLTYWDGMEPQNAAEFSLVPCHPIGTLFQIQNAFCKSENQMTIQVIGRQRCALISPIFRHNIFCEDVSSIICDKVAVRVLDEQLLPKQIIPTPECSFNRLSKKERFKCQASLSPHDAFILWKLSTDGIVERLKKWLLFWFKRRQIDLLIEQGLTQFSYWVAANIPMSLDKKLELLGENSTDRRLRIEWHIISQMSLIVCTECEDPKCSVTDIINLSVEGNSAHFVNPGGFVHDLFTVDKLDKIELRGEPSAEFSWFPGYEWTIVECDQCRSHIGWRFTSSNHQLIPQQFYGISRRSFRLACTKESTE